MGIMVIEEGINQKKQEQMIKDSFDYIHEKYGDMNKYIRRIAGKISNNGMTYEVIDNETITFKGHTITLVNEDGIVSFDGVEMKWTKTAPLIDFCKNKQ